MGGSWRIPVMHNLLDKTFVQDLKADGEPSVSAVKTFSSDHWGWFV
jgi:hypothetical protein